MSFSVYTKAVKKKAYTVQEQILEFWKKTFIVRIIVMLNEDSVLYIKAIPTNHQIEHIPLIKI